VATVSLICQQTPWTLENEGLSTNHFPLFFTFTEDEQAGLLFCVGVCVCVCVKAPLSASILMSPIFALPPHPSSSASPLSLFLPLHPFLQLLDPFESDYPERIEEELQYGNLHARCCAFNRRGTLLATGCNEGVAVLWDFDTRGVVKLLQVGVGPCAAPGASARVRLHV